MTTLHFNFKDMFRSVKLAFSFQRLWIQFIGLLCSYIVYLILTYLAIVIAKVDLIGYWERYGLIPLFSFDESVVPPLLSYIVYGLAVFALIYGYMITATAVSRAVYMHLKGNTFYTWKEAFAFAWKKKLSILGTPLFLALLIVMFILGGGFIGLLGKWIPWAGEIILSLLTVIWYIACLFLVFMGIALIVSVFLTPAILATTDDDAFEGIFQSFSITFTQPWRLLVYEILNKLTAVFGFITFVLVAKLSWKLMNMIFMWSMGKEFEKIGTTASYYVKSWTNPFVVLLESLKSPESMSKVPEAISKLLFFSYEFSKDATLSLPQHISAIIMAIALIILGGYVLCYPLAIFNTGHTLSFLVIKKIKDDENLLERKDREEEEEEETAEEVKGTVEETPAEEKEVKKRPAQKKKQATKK